VTTPHDELACSLMVVELFGQRCEEPSDRCVPALSLSFFPHLPEVLDAYVVRGLWRALGQSAVVVATRLAGRALGDWAVVGRRYSPRPR
jgi:hypothetical protein